MFVDLQTAAVVRGQSGCLDVQLGGIAGTADTVKRLLRDDLLAAVEMNDDAIAVFVTKLARRRQPSCLESASSRDFPEDDTSVCLRSRNLRKAIAGAFIDQRYADSERGEHARVFASDHPRADDGQGARQFVQAKDVVASDDAPSIERNMRVHRGFGAGRDHDEFRNNQPLAAAVDVVHFYRVRIVE